MLKVKLSKLEWVLILLLIHSAFFSLFSDFCTKTMVHMPISISPPGKIETDIHIPFNDEVYHLNFIFMKDGRTMPEMEQIQLIYIPVSFQIYSVTSNELLIDKDINTYKLIGYARDYVERDISYISLPSGDYKVVFQIKQDVPLLKGFNTYVHLGYGGGNNWQDWYIAWASLLDYYITVIEIILFVIVITKRALKYRDYWNVGK